MIDFRLSEEDLAFRDMCRAFSRAEIEPRWRQADADAEFPLELLPIAAKQGLMGLSLPEEAGGQGATTWHEVILTEEMSRVNPNVAGGVYLEGVIVAGLLWHFATEEQRAALLPPVLDGSLVVSLAVTEPTAGSDVRGLRTTAERTDGGWRLSGEKCFITLACYAGYLIVLAWVDKSAGLDGMRFFVVPASAPGVTIRKLDMWAARPIPTCQVLLDNVEVAADAQLNGGFRETMQVFNKERVIVSGRWLGHAQHCLDWALDYATSREQFGKRIGDFQSIAFDVAAASAKIEAARWLTYRAAWGWDHEPYDKDLQRLVSSAKLTATETAYEISQTAMHIGGGWGLVKGELDVGRLAVDGFIAPVTVGSREIQKRIIARSLGLACE
jgi:alkylation response protein AidB-like acyl-CoA dehydrogenase